MQIVYSVNEAFTQQNLQLQRLLVNQNSMTDYSRECFLDYLIGSVPRVRQPTAFPELLAQCALEGMRVLSNGDLCFNDTLRRLHQTFISLNRHELLDESISRQLFETITQLIISQTHRRILISEILRLMERQRVYRDYINALAGVQIKPIRSNDEFFRYFYRAVETDNKRLEYMTQQLAMKLIRGDVFEQIESCHENIAEIPTRNDVLEHVFGNSQYPKLTYQSLGGFSEMEVEAIADHILENYHGGTVLISTRNNQLVVDYVQPGDLPSDLPDTELTEPDVELTEQELREVILQQLQTNQAVESGEKSTVKAEGNPVQKPFRLVTQTKHGLQVMNYADTTDDGSV